MKFMLAAILFALIVPLSAHAADTLRLRTNDVIAFVGGEDMVAMQQFGYLEVGLARDTAAKGLRFRNLGWEGDTVFEQKRDLNFPSWDQTLSKIGATVVVAQFGQAESLRGRDALPQFREAAGKLLTRLAGANRRVVVLAPTPFDQPPAVLPNLTAHNGTLAVYSDELQRLCHSNGWRFLDPWRSRTRPPASITRDGLHLDAVGHALVALHFSAHFSEVRPTPRFTDDVRINPISDPATERLRQIIIAKNQLWFDYWRPQNWAFLAGDRTEQPSSRDHRDLKQRWFPDEMEKFLPLIEAKEKEIAELAGKLR